MFDPRVMARGGALTLADVQVPSLTIFCEQCAGRGRYGVRRLMAKYGAAGLPELLGLLSAGCPKRMATRVTDRCRARFEWPNEPPRALQLDGR